MFDVQTSLQEQAAMVKVAGTLTQSTRIMQGMSRLLKISEIQVAAREMAKGECVQVLGLVCRARY